MGWHSVRLPRTTLDLTGVLVERLPFAPTGAQWVQALRVPVVMDTAKARRELGWQPAYDALATLRETVAGARA